MSPARYQPAPRRNNANCIGLTIYHTLRCQSKRVLWCPRSDSNRHSSRKRILSPPRLPFRHARSGRLSIPARIIRQATPAGRGSWGRLSPPPLLPGPGGLRPRAAASLRAAPFGSDQCAADGLGLMSGRGLALPCEAAVDRVPDNRYHTAGLQPGPRASGAPGNKSG